MKDNEFWETEKRDNIDLSIYYCGMEKCKPSHAYGPAVRDHFLIHYILEGKGSYYVNDKVYSLSKNQGFLIWPDTVTYYEADAKAPWTYMWIAFHGVKAETYLKYANLTKANPIFIYDKGNLLEEYISQICNLAESNHANEVKIQGLLYLFLSELINISRHVETAKEDLKAIYIKKCIDYIEKNYSTNIKIDNLARYVGLNRSYLSTIFKNTVKVSPQEYLIHYRIDKACELMENTKLTISAISRSVGYNDPLTFSRIFKKIKGCSPKEFAKQKIKV